MELNLKETLDLLDLHSNYCKQLQLFFQNKKYKKYRMPNFPEVISENIIKNLIEKYEKIICKRNISSGDLQTEEGKKIECKCFTSNGPCSFGSKENWDIIYFLDAIKYQERYFILYKIELSNKDNAFQEIKINKKETFFNQAFVGKRPRINFTSLLEQIKPYAKIVFQGKLE
jgi:hypothetical protein